MSKPACPHLERLVGHPVPPVSRQAHRRAIPRVMAWQVGPAAAEAILCRAFEAAARQRLPLAA